MTDPFKKNEPQRGWSASDKSSYHHQGSDVDSGAKAQHHTLGKGATQAAAGNHQHNGSAPVGSVQDYYGTTDPNENWLIMDGRELLRADYPELMGGGRTFADGPSGAAYFILPDARDKFIVGAGALHALLSTGGTKDTTLAVGNLPSHTHTIDHTHATGSTDGPGNHDHGVQRRNTTGTGTGTAQGGGSVSADGNTITTAAGGHTHAVTVPAFNGNSGATGSGTSFTNEPSYMALQHIMRVK